MTEMYCDDNSVEDQIQQNDVNKTMGNFIMFVALVLMCFLGFGIYFCYDNPGALQDNIINILGITTKQFSDLYSVYSWPNIVLCLIGGYLIDRIFGIRISTILYSFLILLGQIILAIGFFMDSLFVMLTGRFILGAGAESLQVAQSYYAVRWFKGRELNLIFGLQLSLARVGTAVNFLVMGPLFNFMSNYFNGRNTLAITFLVASAACIISLLSALILAFMDTRRKKLNINVTTKSVINLNDIKQFSSQFWLLNISAVTYYSSIYPFLSLGKVFFIKKFQLSGDEANFLNSLINILSAIACPLLGYVTDKIGCNVFWVFSAILATIFSHLLFSFTFLNPVFAVIILGLSFSMIASALWPMISLIIPEYQLGTAYGISQGMLNLGLALTSMTGGMIVDNAGYLILELFFLTLLFLSLLTCFLLWICDIRSNGNLNLTVAQRNIYQQSKRYLQEIDELRLGTPLPMRNESTIMQS